MYQQEIMLLSNVTPRSFLFTDWVSERYLTIQLYSFSTDVWRNRVRENRGVLVFVSVIAF
jgi:hypothetical protein